MTAPRFVDDGPPGPVQEAVARGYARKRRHRHRWVAIVTFNVANPADVVAHTMILDRDNTADMMLLCIDCDLHWRPGLEATRCDAGDFEAAPPPAIPPE